MSIYSNLASGAAADAERYISAVLELLGDRDPIEVLGATVAWCRAQAGGLSEEELRAPEAEGKWSVAGVLQHLGDSELVWGYRLRKVLAEDRPVLTGFDQDLWARRLGYDATEPSVALATFAALRSANLRLLAASSDTDLDRVGLHEERGEESVRHMMRLYAGHDLVHRRQIERIIGVVS